MRVVLEVNRVKDYSVFLLPDPYRLVVDVYGTSDAAERAALATGPPPGPTTDAPAAKTEHPAKEIAAQTPSKVSERAAPKANTSVKTEAVEGIRERFARKVIRSAAPTIAKNSAKNSTKLAAKT